MEIEFFNEEIFEKYEAEVLAKIDRDTLLVYDTLPIETKKALIAGAWAREAPEKRVSIIFMKHILKRVYLDLEVLNMYSKVPPKIINLVNPLQEMIDVLANLNIEYIKFFNNEIFARYEVKFLEKIKNNKESTLDYQSLDIIGKKSFVASIWRAENPTKRFSVNGFKFFLRNVFLYLTTLPNKEPDSELSDLLESVACVQQMANVLATRYE